MPANPMVGSAPSWLQSGQVQPWKGGPGVTLTGVDMAGLPDVNTDFSGQAQTGADAAYKGATQFFDKDFADDRSGLESQLMNQGFMRGTQGFDDAMEKMQRSQNAAYENAGFQAQGVGHAQAGDLLQRALAARSAALGERTDAADRMYGQSMGVANLGLGARAQDTASDTAANSAAQAAASTAMTTDAANNRAALDASLGMRNLELNENGQDFNQSLALINAARGGVNMPNFGSPAPLDVPSAYNIASGNANSAANRAAQDRAGLYGLGAAALGSYFGGYG